METFGEALRRWRGNLSLREVAARAHCGKSHVFDLERGRRNPSPRTAAVLDEALGAGGELVLLAGGTSADRKVVALGSTRPAVSVGIDGDGDRPDSVEEIGHRIEALRATSTGAEVLAEFDALVSTIPSEYEATGPGALAPRVLTQRRRVQGLLTGRQPPRQRGRLYEIAGQLSGTLGYMAVNTGQFRLARAYCQEALQVAELLDDRGLAAWVRGSQSLCEYYAGDYWAALDLARDGRRLAHGSAEEIRLAVNGEARALGRLGDRAGVDRAVGEAFALAERYSLPAGMSPCLSFEPYSVARIAANAATAYVSVGEPDRVREYADMAAEVADQSESMWSRCLVRLDLATALLLAPTPDPEQAAALGLEAVTSAAHNPIESIRRRSHELVTHAQPWRPLGPVNQLAEVTRTLTPHPGGSR
ncbi:helix-turn-helix transcriptional regulator [Frankia sp. CNm7]|uniref:Helix-turn-helix transcriptional regulator n=1 Tax=Frankia nepalensis TaxID=1836974 RepID=A0A937UPF2_9ACTN|nr:helix-turn-helix transcriptional regulator [Frankia nepalensis]MBL7499878.1 helix-turn-helix transcriptional regulator [Frankia nepalensis]MBL7512304.1 helix-turn-helix transcriptional regulator [Frankia nepalensis]MBL7516973.1 helix-turn-helix transcriptional regulator [Frankia nepalensis]MBL7629012.1 helix-turn-helix transcriptional regulator [Frankia nepalensis]